MLLTRVRELAGEPATVALGRLLGTGLEPGLVVYLLGGLGAGKTTLARGMLRALGHSGAVKSPTYTLVEPYEQLQPPVFHFDLYRLADPEELEFLGGRDYFDGRGCCLVEWPARGAGMLPPADVSIELEGTGSVRRAVLTGHGGRGRALLDTLTGDAVPEGLP